MLVFNQQITSDLLHHLSCLDIQICVLAVYNTNAGLGIWWPPAPICLCSCSSTGFCFRTLILKLPTSRVNPQHLSLGLGKPLGMFCCLMIRLIILDPSLKERSCKSLKGMMRYSLVRLQKIRAQILFMKSPQRCSKPAHFRDSWSSGVGVARCLSIPICRRLMWSLGFSLTGSSLRSSNNLLFTILHIAPSCSQGQSQVGSLLIPSPGPPGLPTLICPYGQPSYKHQMV